MRKFTAVIFLLSLFAWKTSTSQGFTEVATQAGLDHVALLVSEVYPTQGGAAWFDYDNDGNLDIYLTGGKGVDKLYRNNGDGTFTDKTAQAGFDILDESIYTMGVITGDIDNDGDRDVFITTDRNFRNYLFLNNGDSTFTDISEAAGIVDTAESASAAFGDYNKDGYLDIFVSNWCVDFVMDPVPLPPYPSYANFFYVNNGDGTFTDRAAEFGMTNPISASLGVVFSDYDMDNDADILVANDFGHLDNEENELFQNQLPADTFLNISDVSGFNYGMNGMGMAVGDYDEDGDFDYYITNMKRNVLMRNEGNGSFTNVTDLVGLDRDWAQVSGGGVRPKTSWGTAFLDYDHDTYLDLYEVNGDLNYVPPYPSLDSNMLYRNNGDGTFSMVTHEMNVGDPWMSRGFAAGDYDNDGDLDFLVPCLDTVTGNHNVLLCRNDAANGNWLKIDTRGIENYSNRDGYGAIVKAFIGNRMLIREVDGGSSFISHNSTTVHFGLGNYAQVDSLLVLWPSGAVNILTDVAANQHIEIVEFPIITDVNEPYINKIKLSPNPFTDELNLSFTLPANEKLSVSLIDANGRKILISGEYTYKKGNNRITVRNLPDLTAGLYLLVAEGKNTYFSGKVVRR